MNKENIINYVVQTPHNPNKKVLYDMLETLIEGSGNSGDNSTSLKDFIEGNINDLILPGDLTKIGDYAFYNRTKLALTSLPEGLTSIGSDAFYGCEGINTITFKGEPGSISSTSFRKCTNLKTINVPWAEGVVSGAPWGADNATINYNYTGE